MTRKSVTDKKIVKAALWMAQVLDGDLEDYRDARDALLAMCRLALRERRAGGASKRSAR